MQQLLFKPTRFQTGRKVTNELMSWKVVKILKALRKLNKYAQSPGKNQVKKYLCGYC